MSKVKKIIAGIALIIMVISTALYYYTDDDPNTTPDLNQTIKQVVDGINQIKNADIE